METGFRENNNSQNNWIARVLSRMILGLGIDTCPSIETMKFLEQILHREIRHALIQADQLATARGSQIIRGEEILFLLRKNKIKTQRLVKYLSMKDMIGACNANDQPPSGSAANQDEPTPLETDIDVGQNSGKRSKMCRDFFSSLDQTGELCAVVNTEASDPDREERWKRLDQIASNLDSERYVEWSAARRASFGRVLTPKFTEWMTKDLGIECKPNNTAVEMLTFLAYEAIAELVDMILLVRRDKRSDARDPFTKIKLPVRAFSSQRMNELSEMQSEIGSSESSSRSESFPFAEPITEDELREVMRRYYTPRSPFGFGTRHSSVNCRTLIC